MILALLFALTARASNFDDYPECKAVQGTKVPAKDLQPASEMEKLRNCDAKKAYYGIGEPVDYKKARHCAFAQRENKEDVYWGGSTILSMIYANGHGVQRNIDLALLNACDVQQASAEMQGRIRHLEDVRKDSSVKFDWCDDITSGYAQGFCQQLVSDRAAIELEAKFAKLNLAPSPKLDALKVAAKKFRDVRVANEVDQSGTARGAQMLQEQSIQDRDFFESLEKFSKGQTPKFDFKKENNELNRVFKKILANKTPDAWGTVTREGVNQTQKAWVAYRNAWRAYAGSEKADQVDAWFTKKRTHMLKSILGER